MRNDLNNFDLNSIEDQESEQESQLSTKPTKVSSPAALARKAMKKRTLDLGKKSIKIRKKKAPKSSCPSIKRYMVRGKGGRFVKRK